MKSVKGLFLAVAMAGVVLASCDKDDDTDDDNVNQADMDFVTIASMNNYAEIAAGQIAADHATDSAIAAYGEMMITEHTAVGQELKSIAGRLGLDAKDSLDASHKLLMDTLMALSGDTFDSVYIKSQIRDHEMAISLFQNEANNGQHEDLKEFAREHLPHLQMHLQKANSLASVSF